MRLAKQLKAQVNSIKFASQLPTTTEFILNHYTTKTDSMNDDVQPKVVVNNNTEENTTLLISNQTVTFENSPDYSDNSNKIMNNNKRKLQTIITTSQSEGCLKHEKQKLSIKRYPFGDEDSLNSNSNQYEPIMM